MTAKNRKGQLINVPDKAACYCTNMYEIVQCAACGNELEFGDTYTSHEIYSVNGFWGFGVCKDCYIREDP